MITALILLFAQSGAINRTVTQANIHETICQPGYTRVVRPPPSWSASVKRRLIREAGMPRSAVSLVVLDHIVALELGGAPMDPRTSSFRPRARPRRRIALRTASTGLSALAS